MTIWQYAIAVEAGRLMRECETRELTLEEWKLLGVLAPTVERLEREERGEK